MRQVLAVGIPVIGNFVLWALITKLPVLHSSYSRWLSEWAF